MFVYIQECADEKKFSVRMMCTALPVSESGFYKWKRNRKKPKAWQKLLAQMYKILEEDEENKNYGVRRMQIALEQRGIKRSLSKKKIYQLDTTKLTVKEVKTIVWRYTFAYYNTKRVTTVNPNGLPPLVYRKTAAKKSAA